MATIKVACPKCGQKVSGDETFYGTTVECPVCTAAIRFPGEKRSGAAIPSDPAPMAEEPPPAPAEREELPSPVSAETSLPASLGGGLEPGAEALAYSRPVSEHGPDQTEEDAKEGPDLPPSPLWGAVSIVSAVLSVILCVLGGVLFAPLAIIAGHTALAKARHSPVQPAPGHTLGAIGLMIGYVSLAITILVLLALVVFQESLRPYLPWGRQ